MKKFMKKLSLKRRLLNALGQSSLAMIHAYGMGISPHEAYLFLDQKTVLGVDQTHFTQLPTPTLGEYNDSFTG
jgi:hypothetical protein